MMSAEVNMELCGARLSQREALVFGVPGKWQEKISNPLRGRGIGCAGCAVAHPLFCSLI